MEYSKGKPERKKRAMGGVSGGKGPRWWLPGRECGGAMAEFAIILLPLIILLFAIVEFGLIMYDKAVITNASREGARLASLYYPDPSDPARRIPDAEVETAVMNYAATNLITFGGDTLEASDIEVQREQDANGRWVARVTVNYQYGFMILPNLLIRVTGPVYLSAVTVMRDENQTAPP